MYEYSVDTDLVDSGDYYNSIKKDIKKEPSGSLIT